MARTERAMEISSKGIWRSPSHPLHKRIHHALLAGLIELDRQLVAVDGSDVAVAEFLVEDAVAGREGGDGAGRFRHQFAFDGERQAAGAARGTSIRLFRAGARRRAWPFGPAPLGASSPGRGEVRNILVRFVIGIRFVGKSAAIAVAL